MGFQNFPAGSEHRGEKNRPEGTAGGCMRLPSPSGRVFFMDYPSFFFRSAKASPMASSKVGWGRMGRRS